jgi:hypothetical protein
MPDRSPTCRVSGCARPPGGVLSIASPSGGFRISTCNEHGHRASGGELLVFNVIGSTYALGGSVAPPARYEPLQR